MRIVSRAGADRRRRRTPRRRLTRWSTSAAVGEDDVPDRGREPAPAPGREDDDDAGEALEVAALDPEAAGAVNSTRWPSGEQNIPLASCATPCTIVWLCVA